MFSQNYMEMQNMENAFGHTANLQNFEKVI